MTCERLSLSLCGRNESLGMRQDLHVKFNIYTHGNCVVKPTRKTMVPITANMDITKRLTKKILPIDLMDENNPVITTCEVIKHSLDLYSCSNSITVRASVPARTSHCFFPHAPEEELLLFQWFLDHQIHAHKCTVGRPGICACTTQMMDIDNIICQ